MLFATVIAGSGAFGEDLTSSDNKETSPNVSLPILKIMPSTIQSMIQAHCSHSTSVKAHVCLHISLPVHLVLSRKVDFSKEFKRSIHSRKIYEGKGASPPSLPQSLHHHTFSAKEPFSSKQGKATWLHW